MISMIVMNGASLALRKFASFVHMSRRYGESALRGAGGTTSGGGQLHFHMVQCAPSVMLEGESPSRAEHDTSCRRMVTPE